VESLPLTAYPWTTKPLIIKAYNGNGSNSEDSDSNGGDSEGCYGKDGDSEDSNSGRLLLVEKKSNADGVEKKEYQRLR